MKRRIVFGAGAVVASLALSGIGGVGASAAFGADATATQIVDSTIIIETTPVGRKIVGLAVQYDGVVDVGTAAVEEAAFDVDVLLQGAGLPTVSGTHTPTDAYTNDTPELGDQESGTWVVLEFDATNPLSATSFRGTNYDLTGTYAVAQVGSLLADGSGVPARPDTVVPNSGFRTILVDEYGTGSYTGSNGLELPYRIFTPEVVEGQRVPLVLTLHGAGESGTDNYSQVAGNQISVAFADPARQAENPAFVLSPQRNPANGVWSSPNYRSTVIELVKKTIADNPEIDPNRIYLTGLSLGSMGSWAILPENPELFAGAILVCGLGDEAASVATLSELPIWATHSIDDPTVRYDVPGSDYRIFKAFESAGVPVTWSQWPGNAPDAAQEAFAAEARDRAAATGSTKIFTTFPAGTTPLIPHASWIPTYTNAVMLDWLFEQRAIDRVAPEVSSVTIDQRQQVVIEGADALSGVARIEYSTQKNKQSSTAWTAYTGPLHVDAATTLSIRVFDNAGNVSDVVEVNRKDLG